MTFLEKLKEDNPNLLEGQAENMIKTDCPHMKGYESTRPYNCYGNCKECWNREMPNTEPLTENERKIDFMSENAYNKGLKDAWEFIFNKTGNMTPSEFSEIFDCVWARMGDEDDRD